MIPKNISREHIIRAIKQIKKIGIPSGRSSRKFLLEYSCELYPPKYAIGLANKYANGKELAPQEFSGGEEASSFLEGLGFKIVEQISLYMLAVPLISPIGEKHHLINLFPAASIVCVAMLFCSKSHWRIGILTLTTVLVSLIIEKSNRAAAIIAVIALYVSVVWLFLNRNQGVAAHKERT